MLQKGFLRAKNNIHISRGRFLRAFLWGIAATLGVYIMLCGLRNGFRVMETGFNNGPLMFDKVARNRQNVSYALLGAVFGNSIFLATLFMSPIRGALRKSKRLTILNDQIFLGGNFLYLFFKFFTLFGILASLSMDLHYFVEHMYIFYLFAIVLFLESWKHILKAFKGKAFKPMFMNALALALLVFVLSRTSIFNYQKMDEVLLAGNPKVDLPVSSFENVEDTWRWVFLKIYPEDGIIKYNLNKEPIEFDSVGDSVIARIERFRPELLSEIRVHILASHELPMIELKKVENELASAGINNVRYVTLNPEEHLRSRFNMKGLDYRITEFSLNALELENRFDPEKHQINFVWINWEALNEMEFVEIDIHDSIRINGKEYANRSELLHFFKDRIDTSTCFNVKFKPSTSFQNYISILSIYKQALFELRSQVVKVTWNDVQYDWRDREPYELEQREARKTYPYMLLENFDVSKLEE